MMQLKFEYSPEHEAERITSALKKYTWYKESGYRINLPKSIQMKVEKGEEVNSICIIDAVKEEFNQPEYEKALKKLESEFDKIKNEFKTSLIALGGPVHNTYTVLITKYGVGGSYRLPNIIQVNIDYGRDISWKTLAHEIIHLSIEHLIKEYEVEHWKKERLVDLIMNKFFPEEAGFQNNPTDVKELDESFNLYFPDMERVIKTCS